MLEGRLLRDHHVREPGYELEECKRVANENYRAVFVKKYTEDHEWIELDADGKTGKL